MSNRTASPTQDIPRWLPLALMGGVLLTLYHTIFAGETFFWGLPTLQFYPWREYAFGLLRDGHLPTWNPYLGAGAPLLANLQTAIFYPPNWLLLVLPVPFGMSLIALLHVLWTGVGMWLFTGELGLTDFGRAISTLAFALCGYLMARLGSFPTANAGAWIPWIVWLAHRTVTYGRWSDAGGLALALGLQLLAGHAQTAWYSGVGTALYVLWRALRPEQALVWRVRLQGLLLAGLAGILALSVAAIQLIPTAEYLRHSDRSGGLDYETLTNLSYHPARLLGLLAPDFFGSPVDGSYFTEGIFFEDAAYVGLIPLIAAGAALVAWIRLRKQRLQTLHTVPFWTMLAILGLLLAAGQYAPYYRWLYDHVPTFDAFREPVRWLILTDFALAVLAGIGVEHWGRGPRVVFWSRLAGAGGGGLAIMALGARATADLALPELETMALAVAMLGGWIAVAALLTLIQPLSPATTTPVRLWRTLVLLVVALDLGWMAHGLNPTIDADFFDRQTPQQSIPGRIYWFDEYEHDLTFGTDEDENPSIEGFFDVSDYRIALARHDELRQSLLPNINMIDHIPSLDNNDPLHPEVTARYIGLIEAQGRQAGSLLRAAGVTAVFGLTPDGWAGSNPAIAPDPTAANTVWLVPQVRWKQDDEAIAAALLAPEWDPAQTAILQGTPPETAYSPLTAGTVILLRNTPDERHYRVTTDGEGFLVIAETWYPGWSVTVDDQPATLYRANLAFMAVPIPAGESQVVLRYRLNHALPAALLSGGGLFAIAVLLASPLLRRTHRP